MKKHLLTNSLLSMAFVSLLFSCGSRRTVQSETYAASTHTGLTADTLRSMESVVRTTTDTASATAATVTLEKDTILLSWDTVGNQAVLTSAVRIHMLSQLKASEVAVKKLDDVFTKGTNIHQVSQVESDSLSTRESLIQEDEQPPNVRNPTIFSRLSIGLLYLATVFVLTVLIKIILDLAYRIVKRFRDGGIH